MPVYLPDITSVISSYFVFKFIYILFILDNFVQLNNCKKMTKPIIPDHNNIVIKILKRNNRQASIYNIKI